ncbi:hypothetical protein GC163_08815 [bacterium]|nr:hypothetical protein [bacterium]
MLSPRTSPSNAPVRRHGALTVEVALIMPIFVLFLAALLEFGHFCLVRHMMQAAARRGAHLGSFESTTNTQVEAKIREIAGSVIDPNLLTIQIRDASVFDTANFNATTLNVSSLPTVDLSDADTGDCFIVRVEVPYDNVAILPPFWIKGKTIATQAAMRHE